MDFDSIGAFALFISSGVVGAGFILLAGFRMKLKADLEKLRFRESGSDATEELREELRQSIARQSAEIDELSERLDFTERLLTEGRHQRRAVNTPV